MKQTDVQERDDGVTRKFLGNLASWDTRWLIMLRHDFKVGKCNDQNLPKTKKRGKFGIALPVSPS